MSEIIARAAGVESVREDGSFPMILATSGEASDGHIIDVRGIEAGESIPLQVDHSPSALGTVGTISGFKVDASGGKPARLRASGRIRQSGEGEALALRMDLVDAIASGDVSTVSLRWEGVEVTERRDLPNDHWAHVDRKEEDPRKRYGLFFAKSRALEGSLVAIPADREAIIGRAERAESAFLASVYRGLLEGEPPRDRIAEVVARLERENDALREELATLATPPGDSDEDEPVPDAAAMSVRQAASIVESVERIIQAHQTAQDARLQALVEDLTDGRIKSLSEREAARRGA